MVGLAASLTFSMEEINVTGIFVILLAFVTLSMSALKQLPTPDKSGRSVLLLFIVVFLIHLAGFAYSTNRVQAGFELEKKLSMLILPIVFYYSSRLSKNDVSVILYGFVISCVISLLVCIGVGGYNSIQTGDTSNLFYHNLSGIVGMHASYLSMYFFFSIVILLGYENNSESTGKSILKTLALGSVALLTTGIILLSSRMQLVILLMGFLAYITYRLSGKYGLKKAMARGVGVVVLLFAFSLLFPINRERFKQAINYGDEYGISSKWGEMQMRPLVWACALEIIKTSPLVGVGIGDGQDALQECYVENDYGSLTYFPNTRFNAHNQILETAIQLGILGLFIWGISIMYPLVLAIRGGSLLYVFFAVIFALSCVTESMLQRQSGITFFAFFNALLYWNNFPLTGLGKKPT